MAGADLGYPCRRAANDPGRSLGARRCVALGGHTGTRRGRGAGAVDRAAAARPGLPEGRPRLPGSRRARTGARATRGTSMCWRRARSLESSPCWRGAPSSVWRGVLPMPRRSPGAGACCPCFMSTSRSTSTSWWHACRRSWTHRRGALQRISGIDLRLPQVEDLIVMRALAHRMLGLGDIDTLLAMNPGIDVSRASR